LANQKQGAAVRSHLLHSSLAGAQHFTSLSKLNKYANRKTIFLSLHMLLTSVHLIFIVQVHTLKIGGESML
jgi:uncharacterized membrane protein